ncbi:hypothetical protein ACFL1A_02050 [Patescibacteria group bacterium]
MTIMCAFDLAQAIIVWILDKTRMTWATSFWGGGRVRLDDDSRIGSMLSQGRYLRNKYCYDIILSKQKILFARKTNFVGNFSNGLPQ